MLPNSGFPHGLLAGLFFFLGCGQLLAQPSQIPPKQRDFLDLTCAGCHSGDDPEGDLAIELDDIEWSDREAARYWEHVHEYVDRSVMPPIDAEQPSERDRADFLAWLESEMIQKGPVGGTHLRRLSRRELTNAIRQLTEFREFQLPETFPADSLVHGFDNLASGMNLAPAHMEAIAEMATSVADLYFPPVDSIAEPTSVLIPAEDLVISYSSACLIDGGMRLASSGKNERRNSTWPAKFASPATGNYRIRISIHGTGRHKNLPQELEVGTMDPDGRKNFTKVQTFEIDSSATKTSPQQLRFQARIPAGHTLVFRYANGPLDYDDKKNFQQVLLEIFRSDLKLAAAWKSVGSPARGGSGWEQVKTAMVNQELDIESLRESPAEIEAIAKKYAGNSVLTGETIVYKFFEEGPYLSIEKVEVEGPFDAEPSREIQLAKKRAEQFLSTRHEPNSRESRLEIVSRFQGSAFRRPARGEETDVVLELMQLMLDDGYSLPQAYHIAIRHTLMSPAFLFRCVGNQEFGEPLGPHDLASRLSFFLTSAPPDNKLLEAANSGRLSRPNILGGHAARLLKAATGQSESAFAKDFTRGWLRLEALDSLMPDPGLIRKFEPLRESVIREPAETFRTLVAQNASARSLLAPDFVLTTSDVAYQLYELPKNSVKHSKRGSRMEVERFDWRGGVLGMPATMIATANGVDTQPVLRGVWVLENILGRPRLEPPQAVPALTPDVNASQSPKEMLAAHTSEQSCAVCHREIDPLGFSLENLDPVGRWREVYPVNRGRAEAKAARLRVDASGELPDGTKISDVRELKKYLYDHPEPFVECFATKLMIYATGRQLSYREKHEINEIVRQQAVEDYPLKDLIIALIQSEVFRVK